MNIKRYGNKSLFSFLILGLQTLSCSRCSHYLPGLEVLVPGPGLATKANTHTADKDKVEKGKEGRGVGGGVPPSVVVPGGKSLQAAAGSSSELAGGPEQQRTYKYIPFTRLLLLGPAPPCKPAGSEEDAGLSHAATPRHRLLLFRLSWDFCFSSRTPRMLHREPVERSCS